MRVRRPSALDASLAFGEEEGCAARLRAAQFFGRARRPRAKSLAAMPFGCKHEAESDDLEPEADVVARGALRRRSSGVGRGSDRVETAPHSRRRTSATSPKRWPAISAGRRDCDRPRARARQRIRGETQARAVPSERSKVLARARRSS